jgi:ribosomal protein L13E
MIRLFKSIFCWLKNFFNFHPTPLIQAGKIEQEIPTTDSHIEGAKPLEIVVNSSVSFQESLIRINTSVPNQIEQHQKQFPTEINTKSEVTSSGDEDKSEDFPKTQIRKPYKKKSPIEETRIKQEQQRTIASTEKKSIILGVIDRVVGKTSNFNTTSNGDKRKESEADKKEGDFRIQAPYFEISLDDGKIYLILPEQVLQLANNPLSERVVYSVWLNGKEEKQPADCRSDSENDLYIEEIKINLDEPLSNFKVIFPEILQQRVYEYTHYDKSLYVFVAIGNNRGRMYYLSDPIGNFNPLPKRDLWLLLENDQELQTEPISIEEKWIWENYQPYLVDGSEIAALEIVEKSTKVKKNFGLRKSFQIDGESLIGDDFLKESPLFSGESIKVIAPYFFAEGWHVWIGEKHGHHRLISEKWTGEHPLELRIPEDLSCSYGEFQIDICQHGKRIPDDTLFFRWLPITNLCYNRYLSLPNGDHGHDSTEISITFKDYTQWNVTCSENYPIKKTENVYSIALPANKDSIRLLICKNNQQNFNVVIQASIPKLRWRITNDHAWACTSMDIARKELKGGERFDLTLRTNDYFFKYNFEAILKSQDRQLQAAVFVRKGSEYVLQFNQFFDTIRSHSDAITLLTNIWTENKQQFLGVVEPIKLEAEFIQTISDEIKTKNKIIYPMEKPRAEVLCGKESKKHKAGKGFSKIELETVRLFFTDVRRFNIPFDKRRKTCHVWNINNLKLLKK